MFRALLKKELLETILSFKFVIIFPAALLLLLVGLIMGIAEYRSQIAAYSNMMRLNRDQLERSTDWYQVGQSGIFVSKKPVALTVLSNGVFRENGQVARIVLRDVPEIKRGHSAANPSLILAGNWDFHFVMKIILSLFAFLFAYDAVSGEKESGTLRMLLSNPVSRSRIILGKMLGRFLSLAVVITLVFLIGLMLVSLDESIALTNENRLRILFIFLGSLAYLGVFFAIGIMTSCLTNQSIVSLLLSLLIWAMLVFAIPKASVSAISLFKHPPTPAELEAKKVALAKDMYVKFQLSTLEPARRWMTRPSGEVPPGEFYRRQREFEMEVGKLRRENESEHLDRLYRLYEEHMNQQRDVDRLAGRFARLSPAACYDYFLTELTETSPGDFYHFIDQLSGYQKGFRKFVSDMMLSQEVRPIVWNQQDPFKYTRPDLRQIPSFDYHGRPWLDRWRAALGDFGLISLYLALAFFISYLRFLKYDPR